MTIKKSPKPKKMLQANAMGGKTVQAEGKNEAILIVKVVGAQMCQKYP